jgi:hypothetical protein
MTCSLGHRVTCGGQVLRNLILECVVVLSVIVLSGSGRSPLLAQDAEPESPPASSKQSVFVSTHGISRYRPGTWGTLQIDATNRGSEPSLIEAAGWIGGQKNNQFGRSVWLPAEASRLTWVPVFIPSTRSPDSKPMLYSMSVQKSAAGEVLSAGPNEDRIESRQLIVPRGSVTFAVITGGEKSQLAYAELVNYVFGVVRTDTAVLSINAGHLPDIPEALDAVDTLIVIGDSLGQNAAATEAVQDWVRLGGTLWLALDTMTSESAQAVCGRELPVQEIDRVSLSSYSLLAEKNARQRAADEVELERPVQLVRAFPEKCTVLATADGWPASVKTSFGRGRIFASLLSLDGLFIPRGKLQPEQARNLEQQIWITTPGQDLMSELAGSGQGAPLQTDTMREYVTSRIGYKLPGRSTGAAVLAAFCAALIAVCFVIHRMQRPVLLLPGIGILSILSIVAFLAMAASTRTSTDSTITFQLVEASGTQDRLEATGVTAFHSQGSSQPIIQSSAAGMLTFDETVSSSSPVRMVWSDQNKWQLQNAAFSSGVRLAEFRESVPLEMSAVATGTFDESGFRGRLTGNVSANWSDALVAHQSGFSLPVSIDRDGVIASSANPLLPGQHIDTAILNAEQSRRQKVYRSMFDASQRSRVYPSQLTLLAWSDPLKLHTGRLDDDSPTGAMLASFPIVIERPALGSRIRIPSTFLPYRSVQSKKLKIGFAPTFSNTRRTWSTNTFSSASTSLLRFEIPSELLPLLVDHATLTIKISAPLRDVKISSGHVDSLVEVWSKSSPVGTFSIPLSAESSRILDDAGGLNVALDAGAVQLDELDEANAGTQDRHWQVEWMQLEIQGMIQ